MSTFPDIALKQSPGFAAVDDFTTDSRLSITLLGVATFAVDGSVNMTRWPKTVSPISPRHSQWRD
jgi:hypothetical protein